MEFLYNIVGNVDENSVFLSQENVLSLSYFFETFFPSIMDFSGSHY
jgi:hypothetical protein